MFGIRKNLFARLKKSRAFRRAYVKEQIKQGIPAQIRAMREARRMKQSELADLTGKAQSNIARIEDPRYGKFTLQTLLEIADAFDVWLSVEFVSFAEGLRRTERVGQAALNAPTFSDADDMWASGLEILRANVSTGSHIDLSDDKGRKVYTMDQIELTSRDEERWSSKVKKNLLKNQQYGLETTGSYMYPRSWSGVPITRSSSN
ncbi:MAG: helix-turn-helix transcriptional regulator [Devosia sp.]|nr:helix-turn-helix transcriptional regulator [Devosia sp.]